MSHAGGESILQQVIEGARPGYVIFLASLPSLLILHRRGDPRTRSMRVQKQVDSWNEQMPLLVDAYLQYKNVGRISADTRALIWPLTVVGFEGTYPRDCRLHACAHFLHRVRFTLVLSSSRRSQGKRDVDSARIPRQLPRQARHCVLAADFGDLSPDPSRLSTLHY
jgi:hypothetical protein